MRIKSCLGGLFVAGMLAVSPSWAANYGPAAATSVDAQSSLNYDPSQRTISLRAGRDELLILPDFQGVAVNGFTSIPNGTAWFKISSQDQQPADAFALTYSSLGPRALYSVYPNSGLQPIKKAAKVRTSWSTIILEAAPQEWKSYQQAGDEISIDPASGQVNGEVNGVKIVGKLEGTRISGVAQKDSMTGTFQGYYGTKNGVRYCYGGFSGASQDNAFSGIWR